LSPVVFFLDHPVEDQHQDSIVGTKYVYNCGQQGWKTQNVLKFNVTVPENVRMSGTILLK